jgi:hypothetical protein
MHITKFSTLWAVTAAIAMAVSIPLAQAQQVPGGDPVGPPPGQQPPPNNANNDVNNTNNDVNEPGQPGPQPPTNNVNGPQPPTNQPPNNNVNGPQPPTNQPPNNNVNDPQPLPPEPTAARVVLQETYNLREFPNPAVTAIISTGQVGEISSGQIVATLPSSVTETPPIGLDGVPGEGEELNGAENGLCQEGDNPYPGVSVYVGILDDTAPVNNQPNNVNNQPNNVNNQPNNVNNQPNNVNNQPNETNGVRFVPVTLRNTGIGFFLADFADTQVASCVFTGTIAPGEIEEQPNNVNNVNGMPRINSVMFVNGACPENPNECPLPADASISVTVELDDINGNGINNTNNINGPGNGL